MVTNVNNTIALNVTEGKPHPGLAEGDAFTASLIHCHATMHPRSYLLQVFLVFLLMNLINGVQSVFPKLN
jgi:hypothetical protein